jgi:hypothetical protein
MTRHRRFAQRLDWIQFDARIAGTRPLITPTIKSPMVESIMVAIKIRR